MSPAPSQQRQKPTTHIHTRASKPLLPAKSQQLVKPQLPAKLQQPAKSQQAVRQQPTKTLQLPINLQHQPVKLLQQKAKLQQHSVKLSQVPSTILVSEHKPNPNVGNKNICVNGIKYSDDISSIKPATISLTKITTKRIGDIISSGAGGPPSKIAKITIIDPGCNKPGRVLQASNISPATAASSRAQGPFENESATSIIRTRKVAGKQQKRPKVSSAAARNDASLVKVFRRLLSDNM